MERHPIKILFVDDDEDDYVLVCDILSASVEAHYDVVWVSTYDEAFQIISLGSSKFDLYLMDFFLGNPVYNGLKLLETLRERDRFSPIIVLTGKGNHQVDLQALKSGATDYIVKDHHLALTLERSIRYGLEHTKTLRSLERSQSQYRALFEQSTDAIFLMDLAGNFLRCNQRACDMLGYSLEEFANLSYSDLGNPHNRLESEKLFLRLCEGQQLEGFERLLLTKSGDLIPVEISAESVKDEQGHILYIQGIVRSISKRKEMEHQRLQLELERKQKVMLKQLISGFAHDLRTPLAILNTSLYLLEKLNDAKKQQAKLDQIKRELTRLTQSITDVLEISELEYISEIERVPTDVHQILRKMETQTDSIYGEENRAIVFQLEAPTHFVLADRELLAESFQRILKNACHFSAPPTPIQVRSWNDTNLIFVEIIDTGIGISDVDLPHIFDHFYRSSQSRMTDAGASGLGLAIVRRAIELHNGSVHVTSREGEGTRFRVALPILSKT